MNTEEICKPGAIVPGSAVRIVAPAGPVEEEKLRRGVAELERLGLRPRWNQAVLARDGYFAGSADERSREISLALTETETAAVVAARGGYGTGYLLEALDALAPERAKAIVGYSDLTLLEMFAWHRWSWVTFYGPMVAAGFDAGPGAAAGYDERSFRLALGETEKGWELDLAGEAMVEGEAEGRIVGGCLTLLRSLVGTDWEPETEGAILLLEDLNMKPYQVDRALMHLKLAGKLDGVRGFLLGDFPGCEPPAENGPTTREVAARLLAPLGAPIVWGAPVGHTKRPALTIPLGVRARLTARGAGRLEILEPAVVTA
jgi:muramoyltetrapeptide carboxypeptidase